MSGAISAAFAQVPQSVKILNPAEGIRDWNTALASQYAPAQALANVGKTGAETSELQARAGLIGQQAIGAGLTNQITTGRVGLYSPDQAGVIHGQQGASSYPDQQSVAQPQSFGGAPAGPAQPPATGFPHRPLSQPPGPAIGPGSASAPAPQEAPAPPAAVPASATAAPPAIGAASGGAALPSIGMYPTTAESVPPSEVGRPVQSQALSAPTPAIGGAASPSAGGGGTLNRPGASSGGQIQVGEHGVYDPRLGVGVLPKLSYAAIMQAGIMGGDVEKAKMQALADKRAMIGQLVSESVDPRDPTGQTHIPEIWRRNVRKAYDMGLIDSAQEIQFYNHPDNASQFFSQALTPEQQLGYQSQSEGVKAQARVGPAVQEAGESEAARAGVRTQNEYITRDVQGADGNFHQENHTIADWKRIDASGVVSRPADPNSPVAQGKAMSGEEYSDRTTGNEGGAGTGARPNRSGPGGTPTSTAGGGEQFLKDTWLSQMKETYPDWAKKWSDQQILQLRSDDDVSKQLGMDYANHNAPILAKAGIPATAANLRMAHAFGPGGATSIINAPANTPLSNVLSDGSMRANPTYARQTTTDAINKFREQMGAGADLPVAGVVGGIQPGQNAAGDGVRPGVGPPKLTPQQESNLRVQTEQRVATNTAVAHANVERVQHYQDAALGKAAAANDMNAMLDQTRVESQSWTSGTFTDHKMAALAVLDSLRQNVTQLTGHAVMGDPDASIGDWQAFNKNVGNIVRAAVTATSTRAAFQEYSMIAQALPSDTSSPQGLRQMVDMLQGTNDFLQAKSGAAGHLPADGSVNPNNFEREFNTNVSPMAFILHRMSAEDQQAWAAKVSQSDRGRAYIGQLKGQLQFLDRNGFLTPMNTGLPVGRQPAAATAR